MGCTCIYECILLKLALIWRMESQYKEFQTLVIKTSMCIIIKGDQNRLQIASKCRSGKQQVHFKDKTVILLPSTTTPCPICFFRENLRSIYELKRKKSKLRTLIWNQIQILAHNCQKVVLLCWGSERGHC